MKPKDSSSFCSGKNCLMWRNRADEEEELKEREKLLQYVSHVVSLSVISDPEASVRLPDQPRSCLEPKHR